MKTIFYNNNLAKVLYTITGDTTFALGPIIITSLEEGTLGQRTYNHVATYTRQWAELTCISFLIMILANGFYVSTIINSMLFYYIWYIAEYLIRYVINKVKGLSSTIITSFEREARYSEDHPDYHESGTNLFNWVKYLFKNL